ncbi:MAG: Hsp33 family molecular chaperone HslO [Eubacterium sp.]|jgi:molecular chaperone Hsp33|nr:Hsp33 family molecular chaperone HslO [Eubacterium sp.]
MKDYIVRGMAAGNEIRFLAAYTRETVETARTTHNLSPVCSAALGRLLTGGALMGAMCKNEDDVLTLKINGTGPAKSLTVTADAHSNVKGIIYNNAVDLPLKENGHLDVGGAIGSGTLVVIRDEGPGEPYVGQTALVSGEIGEDLTYYFAESEQIPTSVGLGVLVDRDLSIKHAGGFIIQLLPFASEETISKLENSLANVQSVTDYFNKGMTPEEMMRDIIGEKVFGTDIMIEETVDTQYHCNCSRERVTKALISIGKDELKSMIDDGEPVNLHCDFCNTDYEFTIPEIQEIYNSL